MLVADTSALVSIAATELLDTILSEFDVHTAEWVLAELDETAAYDDDHATAASAVLDRREDVTIHEIDEPIESARIDADEGSCAVLATEPDAPFLLTDDVRALPELENATTARVAISPLLFRALLKQDVLTNDAARECVETLAGTRDWLGAPVYRRARQLFEE
jgi:predicted nucleic acid-binding protein